jgi:hypothetical protein
MGPFFSWGVGVGMYFHFGNLNVFVDKKEFSNGADSIKGVAWSFR